MFPENVLKIIRKFADDVVGSLQYSLKQVPENLIYVKMKRKWFNYRLITCHYVFHSSCPTNVQDA